MRKSIIITAAATIAMLTNTAQAAASACLTPTEANALITAVFPDIIDGIATKCAPTLPPNATMRAGLAPLMARYRPAAEAAWPQAIGAFGKLAGEDMKGMSPQVIRPMLGPMMAEMIGKDIKPAQCPQIDRIIGGLAPLPPQNLADIFVAVLELDGKDGKKADLAICPTDGTAASL